MFLDCMHKPVGFIWGGGIGNSLYLRAFLWLRLYYLGPFPLCLDIDYIYSTSCMAVVACNYHEAFSLQGSLKTLTNFSYSGWVEKILNRIKSFFVAMLIALGYIQSLVLVAFGTGSLHCRTYRGWEFCCRLWSDKILAPSGQSPVAEILSSYGCSDA